MTVTSLLSRIVHDESLVLRLSGIALVTSMLSFLAVGGLLWIAVHARDMHYVYPGGHGISSPNTIPDGLIQEYVWHLLRNRHTWDVDTLKPAHQLYRHELHPRLQKSFDGVAEEEYTLAKAKKITSSFAPVTTVITAREGMQRTVVVDGIRRLYVGGTRLEDDARITLIVLPRNARDLTQGFWVFDIDETPIQVMLR